MKLAYYQTGTECELDEVLDALNDDQCRAIIEVLNEEAKTANELADELTIPLSSLYRKLNKLSDTSLLETTVDISMNGKHATRYSVAVDSITLTFDGPDLELAVTRSH